MRIFYLWRSNLRQLEYYHKYKDLETFENNCHDYWLLFPLELLKNNVLDEVIIWRLNPKQKQKDIIFDINGKKFIQRWVDNFEECLKYPKPNISFFRGGFPEYDRLVNKNPKHLGMKLYTGTGRRILPQYGGKYNYCLMEDYRDIKNSKHLPFYKTASNKIFKPINELIPVYDIFWMANFEQHRYKGQEFFIKKISKSKYLKSLKIIHLGNKSNMGKKMCQKHKVRNIEFLGWKERPEINKLICKSKFGIVTSNNQDGCPRVITEILCTTTPVIVRHSTRLLSWYDGIIKFNDESIEGTIKYAFDRYLNYKYDLIENHEKLSIKNIAMMNWSIWENLK